MLLSLDQFLWTHLLGDPDLKLLDLVSKFLLYDDSEFVFDDNSLSSDDSSDNSDPSNNLSSLDSHPLNVFLESQLDLSRNNLDLQLQNSNSWSDDQSSNSVEVSDFVFADGDLNSSDGSVDSSDNDSSDSNGVSQFKNSSLVSSNNLPWRLLDDDLLQVDSDSNQSDFGNFLGLSQNLNGSLGHFSLDMSLLNSNLEQDSDLFVDSLNVLGSLFDHFLNVFLSLLDDLLMFLDNLLNFLDNLLMFLDNLFVFFNNLLGFLMVNLNFQSDLDSLDDQ